MSGAEAGSVFGSLLQNVPNLTVLSCHSTRLGLEGAQTLAAGLASLGHRGRALLVLGLDYCDLGDEGIRFIAHYLMDHKVVNSFSVLGNDISPVCYRDHLAPLLRHGKVKSIQIDGQDTLELFNDEQVALQVLDLLLRGPSTVLNMHFMFDTSQLQHGAFPEYVKRKLFQDLTRESSTVEWLFMTQEHLIRYRGNCFLDMDELHLLNTYTARSTNGDDNADHNGASNDCVLEEHDCSRR